MAEAVWSTRWPRNRFYCASLMVVGMTVSVVSAVLVWLPTYPNLAPVPGSADVVHLISTPYLLLWVIGALVPLLVFLRPKFWGWFFSVAVVATATVIGFAVSLALLPPPSSYLPAIPGAILISLAYILGFTLELLGASLWRRTQGTREAVRSASG